MDLRPIYAVDVGSYRDSSGNGVGDLQGVARSLEYIASLGVGWVWLLPFFSSPFRDNGYDVVDYYAVDPRYGNPGDFMDLVDEARHHGLRVMIDLVVNHTSNEHPWFQAVREEPQGPFRDYYSWNDHPPPLEQQIRPIFPDRVPSVWTWDEAVGSFYFHQFYPFQPSLNHRNPKVHDEIRRIMQYWMALGVSAFRLDAAGHFGEPHIEAGSSELLDILHRYRSYLGDQEEAVLLGEADLPAPRVRRLLGEDRLSMLFDFIGNSHLYLALVQESAEPIVRADHAHGVAPDGTAWVNFLRNLDEVDLERLAPEEQELVIERLAPDPRARIFHRGIRRRLAPMLDNDPVRLRLAFSILLSLPGIPMVVYGDEIGMGDDQQLPGREAVRTAMQWTSEHNAGFSAAPENQLRVHVIRDGPYGQEQVNVAAQEEDDASLLSFVRRAISMRNEQLRILENGIDVFAVAEDRVLATCASNDEGMLVTLANLSSQEVRVDRFWPESAEPAVILGEVEQAADGAAVGLGPHGHAWLRMGRA